MRVIEITSGFRKGVRYAESSYEDSLKMWEEYHKDKANPQPLPIGHIWFDRPSEFGAKPISGYPEKEEAIVVKKDKSLFEFGGR